MDIIDKLIKKVSENIVEKNVGEDNRNVSNTLIELTIEVKAKFVKDSPSLFVCFPVPIEDEHHKIVEHKFSCGIGDGTEESDKKCKIEDGLAILNFGKNYKKGDKEGCKIYFKIKSHTYKSIPDTLNLSKFLDSGKYTFLSDDAKKFADGFRTTNVREIIDKISTWIFLSVKYIDIDEMKNAEWIFRNKIGNCVHYSTLFIAFCRYFKIPCRYVLGFAKYGKFYSHTWAEFYDREIFSWVPMDLALNQKFFVDATHIPISRFGDRQMERYFKEVNLRIPNDCDECFKIVNFGTGSVVEEDANVEINVKGKLL